MDESDFQKAEDHFFEASQIDRKDVTLWFQLASASVNLGNFCNVRGGPGGGAELLRGLESTGVYVSAFRAEYEDPLLYSDRR